MKPDPLTMDDITLRDYFAACALSALVEAYNAANTADGAKACIGADHFVRNVPPLAYKLADAMLEARAQEESAA